MFQWVHGPRYQALFMVDNSQGHSAYAEDALLMSWMNVRPDGKQAHMHDGWFMLDSHKISQSMIFPHDNPDFPNEPKVIKAILTEHRLFQPKLCRKCQNKCNGDKDACCNRCILKLQPDFHDQKSLIQEVIEAAGHLCPNFIASLISLNSLGCCEKVSLGQL
jgi:hypothetical protein